MKLQSYIEALESDLAAIAAVGDEQAAAAAQRLAQALRSSFGMRLLDLLGEAALEVSAQLPTGHVEVRLAGQEPSLVYIEVEGEPGPSADDEQSARITLRLPGSLKTALEKAASRENVSLNTYLVKALARSLHGGPSRPGGNRLTGFAKS